MVNIPGLDRSYVGGRWVKTKTEPPSPGHLQTERFAPQPEQTVTWHYKPRGSYGYSQAITAQFVSRSGTKARIRVQRQTGEIVTRTVSFANLAPAKASAQFPPLTAGIKAAKTMPPTARRSDLEALANEVRELPLEEVAQRLGLEPDKYDKHKWRNAAHNISITGQKFYDWYADVGKGGAIDLTMHVTGWSYRDTVEWLAGRSSLNPPVTVQAPHPTPKPVEEKIKACNIRDESQWPVVRNYLTEQRTLPKPLVDRLHELGIISVDWRHNAMFMRCGLDAALNRGAAIGATLRGTQGDFKGLTPATSREDGYFWFVMGQGEVNRVVIAESPVDLLSLTVLDQRQQPTLYLSADGAGAVPEAVLQQIAQREGQIVAAQDNDRVGELLAWRVAHQLPATTRLAPACKDWNDQLLEKETAAFVPDEWRPIAQALGHTEAYVQRVSAVLEAFSQGQPLSKKAEAAMQQDFSEFRQGQQQLWQWHHAARAIGHADAYLNRIAAVALEYNALKSPVPLSEAVKTAMQQDLSTFQHQKQEQALWAAQLIRSLLTDKDLQLAQPDPNGLAFEGKSFRYAMQGNTISLHANDGRGEILKVAGQQIIHDAMTVADLKKCKAIQEGLASHRQKVESQDLNQDAGSSLVR